MRSFACNNGLPGAWVLWWALVQITSEPAQSGIFTEWVHAAKTAAQISDGVCP